MLRKSLNKDEKLALSVCEVPIATVPNESPRIKTNYFGDGPLCHFVAGLAYLFGRIRIPQSKTTELCEDACLHCAVVHSWFVDQVDEEMRYPPDRHSRVVNDLFHKRLDKWKDHPKYGSEKYRTEVLNAMYTGRTPLVKLLVGFNGEMEGFPFRWMPGSTQLFGWAIKKGEERKWVQMLECNAPEGSHVPLLECLTSDPSTTYSRLPMVMCIKVNRSEEGQQIHIPDKLHFKGDTKDELVYSLLGGATVKADGVSPLPTGDIIFKYNNGWARALECDQWLEPRQVDERGKEETLSQSNFFIFQLDGSSPIPLGDLAYRENRASFANFPLSRWEPHLPEPKPKYRLLDGLKILWREIYKPRFIRIAKYLKNALKKLFAIF